MSKLYESLGILFDMGKLAEYRNLELKFTDRNREFFAKILARYSMIIQPELDEDEVADLVSYYLTTNNLCVTNIHELAEYVKVTMYNPDRDILN